MKIVLDTNVLISGIFWSGTPFKILEMWLSDEFDIIATPDILNEYVRVISSLGKKNNKLVKEWIDLLSVSVHIIEKGLELKISRDPDDDKFLECAISGEASYIISGDDDLLTLKNIQSIPIIKPLTFYRKFEK